MKSIVVQDTQLASVIIVDKKLEEFPEPYRGTKSMELVVSFSAYKDFIHNYLDVNNFLATQTSKLKYWDRTGDERALCMSFYKDMALAVMKELWYVDVGNNPTQIRHIVEDSPVFNDDFISQMSDACKAGLSKAYNELLREMASRKYEYSVAKLSTNKASVDYATLLYAMSFDDVSYGVSFYKWSLERRVQYDGFGDYSKVPG